MHDSIMNWSPINRVGQKRALDELEEGEVESEMESAEEKYSEEEGKEGEEREVGVGKPKYDLAGKEDLAEEEGARDTKRIDGRRG